MDKVKKYSLIVLDLLEHYKNTEIIKPNQSAFDHFF